MIGTVVAQTSIEDVQQLVDTTAVTGWDFLWAAIALVV